MKIVKAVILATVFVLLPAYAFSSNLGSMRISLMEGDVQIKTQEAGEWGLASINAPVQEGDQVWVPEGGRIELQLNTGTYIRVDQDSALEILSTDENSSQFYLSQGHAYIYYRAPEGNVIQVDTPDASTRAFDDAIFRIDIPDQYTDVAVYSGYVETENQIGRTQINAGEMLSLGQDTNGEVSPIGEPDEWETWNKERNDRILEYREASSRYLPPSIREYAYDLDSYGRWVDIPEYGHCWTPKITSGVNWAPYREGRWIWIGGNYVWVADEPWGWAPYHYGRWTFVTGTGWCWVPPAAGAVYWSPGYVGWVRTKDYVAWVPLAPGEIYYGHGYYGPHSENIINVNINQVRLSHVYKNVHVHNGVTVIERNTFATPSPRIVRINQNIIRQKIFVRNNFSVGAPAIKPSKASYFLSARPVPTAKLPPHRIRSLQVKELKHSRPFVRERNKSVWNPGEKPGPLPLRTVTTPKTRGKGNPVIHPLRPAEGKPEVPEGGNTHGKEDHLTTPENRQIPGSRTMQGQERRIAPPVNRLIPGPAPKEMQRTGPGERTIPESRPAQQEERHIVAPPEKKFIPGSHRLPEKEERRIAPPEKTFIPEGRPAPKEERRITPPENRLIPGGQLQIEGGAAHQAG